VRLLGRPRAVIAGVRQATSLTVIVAATQIGLQLGVVSQASAAGLVAAGLLSVVISPALGLMLFRRAQPESRSRPSTLRALSASPLDSMHSGATAPRGSTGRRTTQRDELRPLRQEPNDELDEPVLARFAPVPQPGDSDEERATADEDAHGAERRVAVNDLPRADAP
jgi:hypothetical protein